ncbi:MULTISPECIES: GGDEF domain-containing protein [unclassified Rhodococcus (in: high G+C Gram-positive bacteria)]|uniref:GGDEF domain-containing protein n=1 Tax=unclassified Rhodococcus (in: high G+C Gram-positive bacteria) TaxID=192944 RepID=UPI00277F2D31|nr:MULTISPECIES: GGDEF domain-containing protein [unclassified Rhodococcus (in: high G+C Gram-positive bacteria)]MDQ1199567.1 diguanylate cyclase (GGDEF)-like protein [Rhodococcus sp. SORGH_AS_0303]
MPHPTRPPVTQRVRASRDRARPGRHSGSRRIRNAQRRPLTHRPRDSALDVVRRWLTTPHDFDWIFVHHSTRSIHGIIRLVFAGAVLLNATVSMLMLASPNGPSGTPAIVYVFLVLALQIAAMIWVLTGPTPDTKAQFLGFLIFGDVGIASVILLDTPTSALIGTFLFAINGALCTFFLSPRVLLAHLAFTNAVIVLIGTLAYVQNLWGPWDAIAAVLVASGASSGVPVFASIAWSLVSTDAKASDLDSLTGVRNRRGLQNSVEDLWETALATTSPVVVVMIDIDRFKSVNDRFGHDQGDTVIVLVATRLAELFDGHGVLARTGGEEFVAVLTDVDGDVESVVARVTETVHDRQDTIPVTASVGVAVLTPDSSLWSSGPGAIDRATRGADSMMYRAKAAGGHRLLSTFL